jgi:hypothetical protein
MGQGELDMRKMILTAGAAMALAIGACSSQMHEVQKNNKETSCESGCIAGRDQCVSECQSRAATGDNPDNASCQLACDHARKECNDKCE